MKTPNKRYYPEEVFVNADQWKITKLTQTCFTRRGLEISGWPKPIHPEEKSLQLAITKMCMCQTEEEHTSSFFLIICFFQKLEHPDG